MVYSIKLESNQFSALHDYKKKFLILENTRQYKVDDVLIICEYDSNLQNYTERKAQRRIIYLEKGDAFLLKENYVIVSFF